VGSRRGRHPPLAVALAAALGLAGCTSGPPPGFAGGTGDRWAFPLVGALEDDLLIAPVTIDGRGPFLFGIDPDANASLIDERLVKELKLVTRKGPDRVDESETKHPRFYAEVNALELGTLIVERRDAMIVKVGTLDVNGRRIHGMIGKDVLADSFVFGFDRDQGFGYLTTVKAFKPPPGAIALPFVILPSRLPNAQVLPTPRRLVRASIGGEPFTLHLDLGAAASQLRESLWARAKLTPKDVNAAVIDEVGMPRAVTKAGISEGVTVGSAAAAKLAFVPYADKRWSDREIDGTLGLDFFRAYTVWLDGEGKTCHVGPRRPVEPKIRITRWESGALDRCTQLGCVTVRLVDPLAGKPVDPARPHPGLVLSITREEPAGGMGLEVILEATGRPELPRLVVNLPPTADRVIEHLRPEWVGAALVVVDASPYPRQCPAEGGCVDLLAR
jgi:hypothetical protein